MPIVNYISINSERLNHNVFLYLLIINHHNMIEYQDSILESKLFIGSGLFFRTNNQQNSKEDSDANSLKLLCS